MKYTEHLRLPIYDNPEIDLFKIDDVNDAHTIIDEQYSETKISLNSIKQDFDNHIENHPSGGAGGTGDGHLHSNKTVLDGITSVLVSNWNNKANQNHTHNDYANSNHTHSQYATSQHEHTEYSTTSHIHNYAETNHTHSGYANVTHIHTDYANTLHEHLAYQNKIDNTLNTTSKTIAGAINELLVKINQLQSGSGTVAVSSVSLNKNSISLNVGEQETLYATVLPSNATNKTVTWSSSNPNIISVTGNGVVTAVSQGNAVITVTTQSGSKTASCNVTVSGQSIGLEDLTMARIDFTGDITGMTDEIKKVVQMTIKREDGSVYLNKKASLKWQGSSSLTFNKKNYSITLLENDGTTKYNHQFFEDVEATSGYHIKANYADYTMCRNIVSAKAIKDCYDTTLPNNPRGLIDGFPVVIYVNGEKYGIYTWNLKQDPTVYKFDSSNPNHIMYRGTPSSLACEFRALSTDNAEDANDWEDKFPETNSASNRAKLNRMIQWVMDATDETFANELEQYFNKEYLLKYIAICEYGAFTDSLANNMNLVTYDGNIWYLTFYDMDACWGSGAGELIDIEYNRTFESMPSSGSILLTKARRVFGTEINSYIKELSTVKLSASKIENLMNTFINSVGSTEYQYDCTKWNKNTEHGIYGLMPPATTRKWIDDRSAFLNNDTPTTIPVEAVSLSTNTHTMKVGESTTLVATVIPINATNKNVVWSTNNSSVATVSNGYVYGVSKGVANITVTTEDGNKASICVITIKEEVANDSIVLEKTEFNVNKGDDVVMNATINMSHSSVSYQIKQNGYYFTEVYKTGTSEFTMYTTFLEPGVYDGLTIVARAWVNGVQTDVAVSQDFTVTVTSDEQENPNISVTGVSVSPSSVILNVGEDRTLYPTITPSDATNQNVTWSTSNSSVANVTSSGVVTAIGVGNTTITVTTQDGNKTATCNVMVENQNTGSSINLTETSYSVVKNDDVFIKATINILESSPSFEIYKDGVYFTNAYKIDNETLTMYTTQIDAGVYNNLTVVAKAWVSGEKQEVATSQSFTLEITSSGGGGGTNVAVTGVSIFPSSKTMKVSESYTLTPTISPYNATNTNVSWSSSKPSVVNVSSAGVLSSYSIGTSTITCTTQDGNKTATCSVTVESSGADNNATVLDMQYATSHGCVPNCPDTIDWKAKPRIGHGQSIPTMNCDDNQCSSSPNYQAGTHWKSFCQWLTVYKENGKSLVENVGVELTDFKMWRYNTSTSQWILVNDEFDYGSFYLEDFWDDGNSSLPNNKILSSDKKTYKCLMNSATAGRCFHPFATQKNWADYGFSGNPCHVVSQVKFRLIKWNESGADNRANAHIGVNVGGDYWIYKGSSFDSKWRHNGDFAIGYFKKATNDWQTVYATSCPSNWDKGFPI